MRPIVVAWSMALKIDDLMLRFALNDETADSFSLPSPRHLATPTSPWRKSITTDAPSLS
jgi:hypothetical protein